MKDSDGSLRSYVSSNLYGYNVLIPDARAHGKSQGKYIGYGWPEEDTMFKNGLKRILLKKAKNKRL